MDLSELQALASASKAKHVDDCHELNARIEAENRRVHLRNAMQRFGSLWSSSFMDSLPAERIPPGGEWTGAEWATHRPEFDEWRTDRTLEIAADPRVQGWKDEFLTLTASDVGARNTAILMLQSAAQGQRDVVREIWKCMLVEEADDKERFPSSDPALLPSQVIMWLKWKLAEELTQTQLPSGETSLSNDALLLSDGSHKTVPQQAERSTATKAGGRPRKWERLDELISKHPELTVEEIMQRHNSGNWKAIELDSTLKATKRKVRERRNELNRRRNSSVQE